MAAIDPGVNGAQGNADAAFTAAFEKARRLQAQGDLIAADAACRELLRGSGPREPVLRALVEISLQGRRVGEAIDALVALTHEAPDSIFYYARLAALLEGIDQIDAAIAHYQRLLQRQPAMAPAHFNLALLYKKSRRPREAAAAYEEAIRIGIERVEEVYSNLGALYAEQHDPERARALYTRALETNPVYVPAMFNLAGLHEEMGERQAAIALYERILALNPRHWASLARLAHATTVAPDDNRLVQRLQQAVAATEGEPGPRESLGFALGKVLDDQGRYAEAFAAYRAANNLGRLRHPPHDRGAVERHFDKIMELVDADWVRTHATSLMARPIFICGMFRSGSTLVEQVLGAHPDVAAGGELEFLPWLINRELGTYPAGAQTVSRSELEAMGGEYLASLRARFPGIGNVTDKQPANFTLIGLIKAIFPAAHIVCTRRDPRDTGLSIYFQQLDEALSYANDLGDIAHYQRQHDRLMSHWRELFGNDIHTVDYDDLVRDPEPVLRALFAYLDLPWDDRCLRFQDARVQVKTASVWQVREPLHANSSGRWKHYAAHIGEPGAA